MTSTLLKNVKNIIYESLKDSDNLAMEFNGKSMQSLLTDYLFSPIKQNL